MRSTAFCPSSGMLAQCGAQEWRGGKVDASGKSLRSGCDWGGHLSLLLNLCNLFPARWEVGGCKTGAEHLCSGYEVQDWVQDLYGDEGQGWERIRLHILVQKV